LQLFEETDSRSRIVAGVIHVLKPEVVGFGFSSARERQERYWNDEASRLAYSVSSRSRDKDQRNCRNIQQGRFRLVLSAVPRRDVGDFVRHDARKLGFIVRGED